jgi:aryl-alcohol dehydrogenase (NADP+)
VGEPKARLHFLRPEDYVAALALRLEAEDERFIGGLVPSGHASTHGYTDPLQAVMGPVARAS